MRLIAFIVEPTVAKRILDHLDLDSTARESNPFQPRCQAMTFSSRR